MSAYDVVAPSFDSYRALPARVPEAIRAAVLRATSASPRILDLGAGSGRIGGPFVAAGDDYVGVDLSSGMLREFAGRAAAHNALPRLIQADGQELPFRDAMFDAVMLVQVFGGLRGWRRFVAEARRVLRSQGAIIIGRTEMPPDGIDACMKQHLAAILGEFSSENDRTNARDDITQWLAVECSSSESVTAASWTARRTPRGFIERHGSGARFATLPTQIKSRAMDKLAAWATATFGSLDATASEPHAFNLQIYRFQDGNS